VKHIIFYSKVSASYPGFAIQSLALKNLLESYPSNKSELRLDTLVVEVTVNGDVPCATVNFY